MISSRYTYLAAQLRMLPTVPIIAFGDKADEALRRLSFRATKVPHPSARASNESKPVQWERSRSCGVAKALARQRTPAQRDGGPNSGRARIDRFTPEELSESARCNTNAWKVWRRRVSQLP